MPSPLPREVRESVVAAYIAGRHVAAIARAHGIAVASVYRVLEGQPERVRRRRGRRMPLPMGTLLQEARRAGNVAGVGLWTVARLAGQHGPPLVKGPVPVAAVARGFRALGFAPELAVRSLRARIREDPAARAQVERALAGLRQAWPWGVRTRYVVAVPLTDSGGPGGQPSVVLAVVGPSADVRFRLMCGRVTARALRRFLQQVISLPRRRGDRSAGLLIAAAGLAAAETPLVQAYLDRRAHDRPPWRLCVLRPAGP